MRLDDWPESQPATPAPDAETADALLPPLMGAGEGLAASSPESLQPDPGADEGQSPAEAPSLADAPAPPTADARLSAGIGQPDSPDDSAGLPPAGAAPPAEPPPLSPAAAALDNARRGTWMMDEHLDGWVLLGADGRPVMRNDGSRVGFRFFNVARLADELAAAPHDADGAGNPRRALAPLDSGFNRDWDPQIPMSALADRTKLVKLLAYRYVQTTEPQEAVRRAVSDIFGNPVYIEQPGTKAWVPAKYDAGAVKSVAGMLLRQVLGPEADGNDAVGAMPDAGASPTANAVRGLPRVRDGLGANISKVVATSDNTTSPVGDRQLAQAEGGSLRQGRTTIPGDKEPPRAQRDGRVRNLQLSPRQQQTQDTSSALSGYRYSPFDGALARKELGRNPNEGYSTYVYGAGNYAYGRYQMRPGALTDTKMIDAQGNWTGKFGVRSWQEFLENPQAQEAAFSEWKGLLETSVQTHHLQRLGKTITGLKADITVTESGLVAAMHIRGRAGVIRYFEWLENKGWNSRDHIQEISTWQRA